MKYKPTYRPPFRRRREGKTDYRRRLMLLKSEKPRLVVRRSLKYITAQIIEYVEGGDKTLLNVTSGQLKGMGWQFSCDSIPAAYLTGLLVGKMAVENKITEAVLDFGLYRSTKGSRIYAVAKGARDAGLQVPMDESMAPSEDRLAGKHISALEKFKDLPVQFEKVKDAILKSAAKPKMEKAQTGTKAK